eukprot:TRINITY_DN4899_c0_g1::TRINITY_DN4899_c0_g1_i1::g.948::m.948 TRINITY_DN4899_c0_g1::TRINITY_DN4899_c0_g1_i1::g.948  ORF type:complete len:406 (+),score=74.63,sp/Q3SWT4/IWS1_RAT/35.80/7e-36,Med26/PF08711.6/4.4e-15 TRINITY_DN4899_c0_g1_i1:64-1281(+)
MSDDDFRELFGDSSSEDEKPKKKEKEKKQTKKRKKTSDDEDENVTISAIEKKARKKPAVPRKKAPAPAPVVARKKPDDGYDSATEDHDAQLRKEVEDGFIDDTGAEPMEEDEDDIIRTEGGFGDEAIEEGTLDDFDAMLQRLKKGHSRRSQAQVDQEEVQAFVRRMQDAATSDRLANKQGKPGIHKLKMLHHVVDQLTKEKVHEAFLENGILDVLRSWLDPLPDRSLPNINVRNGILKLLQRFSCVETEQLKSSGLGRVINFLAHHEEETAENKRLARILIQKWSAQIIELNTDYTSLKRADNEIAAPRSDRPRKGPAANTASDDIFAVKKQAETRLHARIPMPMNMSFSVRPKSLTADDDKKSKDKKDLTGRGRILDAATKLKKSHFKFSRSLCPNVSGNGLDA